MKRRFRLQGLVVAVLVYGGYLAWIHHLARSPFNLRYYTQYVIARCTDAQYTRFKGLTSPSKPLELSPAIKACQDVNVAVDGLWGGSYGKPSLRLKVTSKDGSHVEMKYYQIGISPVASIASIDLEIDPSFYYLNP